ncbi:retron system putative HNH endonuclease [Faucicola boevrei]|uniref:retron system putative HNH endonuclease n=1 Tax=Faucicola boevrei TaxID=346665 RepID=UPI00037A20FC|nr:retron system putative HNH endonuclease [Moraxella boevrei]
MQYIDKKLTMPMEVQNWIKKNNPKEWLSDKEEEIYIILREQLRQEQNNLCCYCCQALKEYVKIEHIKSRDKYKKLIYKYDNLLLSCTTPKQCDNAKGNQDLLLTPLMQECDDELKINFAGELEAKTDRAKQAIEILNLNNRKLCEKRRAKIDMIKFTFDPNSILMPPVKVLDKDTLHSMIIGEQYFEFQYILKKLN